MLFRGLMNFSQFFSTFLSGNFPVPPDPRTITTTKIKFYMEIIDDVKMDEETLRLLDTGVRFGHLLHLGPSISMSFIGPI